jgi:nicotinamide-nucleotide amidase
MTLSIAESCTGGLISSRITNISGSSKYFDRGIVTYGNESKIKDLGVSKKLIKIYGAVSRQVATAMAKGMLKKSGSDVALAVTGIAGPTGGTKKKPVGLVYIAIAKKNGARCIECHFLGSRTEIKYQTSTATLDLLRKALN